MIIWLISETAVCNLLLLKKRKMPPRNPVRTERGLLVVPSCRKNRRVAVHFPSEARLWDSAALLPGLESAEGQQTGKHWLGLCVRCAKVKRKRKEKKKSTMVESGCCVKQKCRSLSALVALYYKDIKPGGDSWKVFAGREGFTRHRASLLGIGMICITMQCCLPWTPRCQIPRENTLAAWPWQRR